MFVVNRNKPMAQSISQKLALLAREGGLEADVCEDFPVGESAFVGKDVCCVIGGDGTILSCVQWLSKYSIPVFGINLGKLGFLATYTEKISDADFLALARGEGRLLKRSVLEARYQGKKYLSLNDFVIKDSRVSGISEFRIFADGEFIADYVGDGLIFSTPTGSTAYNLSAGGPIVHPKARSFLMTPICPHTLSNRSLVYDASAKIKIVCTGGESALMADGVEVARTERGSEIELDTPDTGIEFVRLRAHSHFGILRSKLGWAEDPRANHQK